MMPRTGPLGSRRAATKNRLVVGSNQTMSSPLTWLMVLIDPFPPLAVGSRRIVWLATPQPTRSWLAFPTARPAGEQAVMPNVARSKVFSTVPSALMTATPPGLHPGPLPGPPVQPISGMER